VTDAPCHKIGKITPPFHFNKWRAEFWEETMKTIIVTLVTMKRQLLVLIVLMISFSPMVLPVTSGERRRSLDLTSGALAQGETENERGIKQGLFAEGIISTDEPEYAPTFSLDGKIVYFTRMSRERRFPAIDINEVCANKS
jgi:hypothetical protein